MPSPDKRSKRKRRNKPRPAVPVDIRLTDVRDSKSPFKWYEPPAPGPALSWNAVSGQVDCNCGYRGKAKDFDALIRLQIVHWREKHRAR